jgi:hypothetical protein
VLRRSLKKRVFGAHAARLQQAHAVVHQKRAHIQRREQLHNHRLDARLALLAGDQLGNRVPLLQNQPLEPTQRLDALVQGNLAPVQVRLVRPRNHRLNRF